MLIAQNTLCKSVWLRHEQPELYEQTYKILQAKDYLVYRLTGNLDSTDLSDASYGALVSLSRRAYDRDFFRAVDLDPDKFPTVHTGCEIAGHLTEEAAGHLGLRAGIPVSVGGGTSARANVGGGTAKNGDVLMELESRAWISTQLAKPFLDPDHRVFNICTMDGQAYYVSGKAMSACRSVSWAQQIFEVVTPRAFDAAAATVAPGCEGLIYLAVPLRRTFSCYGRTGTGRLLRYDDHAQARAFPPRRARGRGLQPQPDHRRPPRAADHRPYADHRRRRTLQALEADHRRRL